MKFLKWAGIVLLALIVIVAVAVLIISNNASNRLNKAYDINPDPIEIPNDSASIARGTHLANVICASCHGGAFEGKVLIEDPQLATVYAPNLTGGEGGISKDYSVKDWVRSIRHGVNPDGKPLLVMPAKDFQNFSKKDLGSIIAYMQTLPPADNQVPEREFGLLGKILLQLDAFGDIINVETIDHEATFASHPVEGPTKEYGEYLVNFGGCQTCHAPDLGGAQGPEPGAPYSPNLTTAGNLGNWGLDEFTQSIRTGVTPEGNELDREFMAWPFYAKFTDMEFEAIYKYLNSLPPVERENK